MRKGIFQGSPVDASNRDGQRYRASNSHDATNSHDTSNSHDNGAPQNRSLASVAAHFRPAFALLLQGQRYAEASGRSVWDYAVELQDLKDLGLTNNDLRWMSCHEWVKHASEIPSPTESARAFEHENELCLSNSSCFVLTDPGVVVANRCCSPDLQATKPKSSSPESVLRVTSLLEAEPEQKPRWDAERHRLYVAGVLVKEFKLPCPNQGVILMAFEEEGWPARIDDPLPPSADTDPKTRLSSTIKSLNKNQKNQLIRFMGDGSGEGVMWELVNGKRSAC